MACSGRTASQNHPDNQGTGSQSGVHSIVSPTTLRHLIILISTADLVIRDNQGRRLISRRSIIPCLIACGYPGRPYADGRFRTFNGFSRFHPPESEPPRLRPVISSSRDNSFRAWPQGDFNTRPAILHPDRNSTRTLMTAASSKERKEQSRLHLL